MPAKKQIKRRAKSYRPVDKLADNVSSKWKKSYVYVKKTKVATWKGALVLFFVSGLAVSLIWAVKNDYYSFSGASGTDINLSFSPVSATVTTGQTFTTDVLLNTQGSNIVVARALVNFDTTKFELVSWDTSSSVFSIGNTCQYNGKACEIIEDNRTSGSFGVTLAKPTPGVNTASGKIVSLTFKALTVQAQSSDAIRLNFVSAGNATDSDVILDDGNGADVLASVAPIAVTVNAPVTTCTSFVYSAWGTCSSDGTQSRTVTSSLPTGCTGGTPILTQSCTYTAPTCTSFTYSAWGTCSSDGIQTRIVTSSSPTGCAGGTPVLTQSCTYTAPTCTSFKYSAWSICLDGTQTRTVISGRPTGCTGGNPILTQTCTTTSTKPVRVK